MGFLPFTTLPNFWIYPRFAQVAFQRQTKFFAANLSGLFTGTFFMIFRAAVLTALYQQRTKIGGYSLNEAMNYVVLVQALITAIPQWGSIGVGDDIRTGQVAMDLCRPFNYYLMILFKRLGMSLFFLLGRAFPSVIIGCSLGFFTFAPNAFQLIWGFLSLFLGIWLAISLHFLIELTGFWLESPRGAKMLVVSFTYFCSGATIPLAFFPDWAQSINAWLPFAYTLNAPIEAMLGAKTLMEILLPQVAWVGAISLLCFFTLKLGERKVVIHGG